MVKRNRCPNGHCSNFQPSENEMARELWQRYDFWWTQLVSVPGLDPEIGCAVI